MLILFAQAATEATEAAASGGIAALGFDWKALLFQVINFGILLFILRLIAYRPILRVLENRRQKIEDSLRAGSELEHMKKSLAEEQHKVLQATQVEMRQALTQSKAQAEQMIKIAEQKAKERGDQVLAKARQQATEELTQLKHDFKKEAMGLVATATEQLIGEKLDAKQDEVLINRALKQAEETGPL